MAETRLFVPEDLKQGKSLSLYDKAYHYICHVLRYKLHHPLKVFNGRQGEYGAIVTSLSKKEVVITLGDLIRPQQSLAPLTLYAPPLRPTRMTWLLEKITELGVTSFYPLKTEYTTHPLGNPPKLQRQMIEAAEQCERLCIPVLHEMISLTQLLQTLDKPLLWAYERSSYNSLASYVSNLSQTHALLIGPEGGFSPQETELLKQHPFVQEISLSSQILRAETAAMTGLFLLGLCKRGN